MANDVPKTRVAAALAGEKKKSKPKTKTKSPAKPQTKSQTKSKAKPKAKDKKPKSHAGPPVHKMHIRRAANGGYIAEHEFKTSPGSTPVDNEEHQLSSMDELKDHLEQHMGDQPAAVGGGMPGGGAMATPSNLAGGGMVQKTGWAQVHEGERVIPAGGES